MTLDIIIPALNEYKNLSILLPYLKDKITTDEVGIIVVDADLSDDNSEAICREHDITYIRCHASKRSIQMNTGARSSKAETLMFLHADVIPPELFIHEIMCITYSGIEFGIFTYKFDDERFPLRINSCLTKKRTILSGGGDQCHFMTRRLYDQLNGYNEQMIIMEDFDFFERMKKATDHWSLLENPAIVSARKYKKNNYLKIQFINLITFMKYKMGFSQTRLLSSYNKLR